MPESDLTLDEFLRSQQILYTPRSPEDSAGPRIAVPLLPGWGEAPAETLPGAYRILINSAQTAQQWTPNAVVLHGSLTESIDTEQLLACTLTDSGKLPEWALLESNTTHFQGYPSVYVTGTYRTQGWLLSATTRYIIVEAEQETFLTQLTVTTLADQDTLAKDVAVINEGLTLF